METLIFILIIGVVLILYLQNKLSELKKERISFENNQNSLISKKNDEITKLKNIIEQYSEMLSLKNGKIKEFNSIVNGLKNELINEKEILNKKINELISKTKDLELQNNEIKQLNDSEYQIQKEIIDFQTIDINNLILENKKLNIQNNELIGKIEKLENDISEANLKIKKYHNGEQVLSKRLSELEQCIKEKDDLFGNLNSINDTKIVKISSLLSDFYLLEFNITEKYLLNKKRPAVKEAKRINELRKEAKKYHTQYNLMKYKYEFLLKIFPELTEFVESFETIQHITQLNNLENYFESYDNVKNYISKEEYLKLNEIERNQLALDNYIRSTKKTNWQIGRDYELMCGIDYINEGWNVEFFGIEKKFKDMGRDLIARKDNEIHIVQCKLWSKRKLIHENHIAQLFGTTQTFEYDRLQLSKVTPVFITNTELSDTAKLFAEILEVKVIKKEMKKFPRIKCNVTINSEGQKVKIYHLPFDQQYDRTHIKTEDEFYAYTVKEAVEKGFRRALKYQFKNNTTQ